MTKFNIKSKIIPKSKLEDQINSIRNEQKSIAFTNGCFDILHYGHIMLFQKAAEYCDILIVGLNSDTSIKMIKGSDRPVNKEDERSIILASLTMIDYVVLFSEPDPLKVIKIIKPDVLIKGGDWVKSKIIGANFVEGYGGSIITVPYIEGFSTTGLINRLKK